MNQRNSFFIIIAPALAGGFAVMISILLGGGNEIAAFYQYLLAVLFAAGFLAPRGAFVFWLVLCGYTDLLKRLMVVTGRVSFEDLYYVLGIPPVMLGAITMSVLVGAFSGRFQLRRLHWTLFAVACIIIVAVTALSASNSGSFFHNVLPTVANSGLYFILIFLVPALYRTTDEVLKLLRIILWMYLPVALYGVYQEIYGYRDFEIEYLKSGLSIEIKQLFAEEIRAFSTLNSTTALATICAALFSVGFILLFLPKEKSRHRALGWVPAGVLAVAYLAGLIASTGRAAFSLIAFSLAAWWCFRSKRLTIAAYAFCGVGFFILVFSADQLLANMNFFQDEVATATGSSPTFMQQMTRVGTYSDRLIGFSNLAKNPDVWTLFGHPKGDEDDRTLFSHDLLTNSLVHYGVIPVLIAVLLLIVSAVKAHKQTLRIRDPMRRSLSAALLALSLSFLVLSLLAGNVMVIFPINVFACLFCGLTIVISEHDGTLESEAQAEVLAAAQEKMPGETVVRITHRFARTGNLPLPLDSSPSP